MEITEVRIKLMENPEDRLRGFCSITFDYCFVVRDLKIIEGNRGPFVAMPSRKLTSNCHKCRCKNNLKANYCNQCGGKLRDGNIEHDANGRAKLYADIAHPINAECREVIQSKIVEELEKEIAKSKEPGYRSRYDEGYDDRPKSRPEKRKESHPPTIDSDTDSKPKIEQSLNEPIVDSQAEVETRIDIPNPSRRGYSTNGDIHKRKTESLASDTAKSSINGDDASDNEDGFGKGIFK